MRKISLAGMAFMAVAAGLLYLAVPPFVCSGYSCIRVELARAPAELELGLMHRTGLDGGMLFIFPGEGSYGFWMKDMGFPIDIVWISSGHDVLGVSGNVPPCSDPCPLYYPPAPVKYVLEVPSNSSASQGLSPGRKVVLFGIGGY